ncbi:MAG: hypothetical protein ABFD89_15125 [Bryobacteraceae bacterium]
MDGIGSTKVNTKREVGSGIFREARAEKARIMEVVQDQFRRALERGGKE